MNAILTEPEIREIFFDVARRSGYKSKLLIELAYCLVIKKIQTTEVPDSSRRPTRNRTIHKRKRCHRYKPTTRPSGAR
jgi:hypothetical protein